MKFAQRILSTFVFVATLTAFALADTMPKDLAATMKSIEKAIQKLDFKAFSAAFGPDFILIDPAGKSTSRKDFLAGIGPMFMEFKSGKHTATVKDVAVMGDYVEVKFDMVVELKGKAGTMKIHEVGSDSWHKVNGKWLLYRTVQEKFEMTEPRAH